MAGIQIPISADTVALQAAVAEMRAMFAELTKTVRAAVAPAQQVGQEMRRSFINANTGATQTTTSLKGMVGAASNAGMAVANIVAGAKGLRSAFNFVRTLSPAWKSVAAAVAGAGAAIVGIAVAVRVARSALSGLLGAANGVWRGIKSGAASAAASVRGVFSGIAAAIPGGGMLGPLAGIAGIAGSIALLVTSIKSGAELAGGIERTGIALEALTGSGTEARRVMDEMRATWTRTGVSIADQATTIQKFLALGFKSNDAITLQRNILDVAGAVGMSATEAALLGSALAQVKAKGVVSMEELRQQIAEKGVPVIEALAAKMGVTEAALISMVEEGKVPAQELIDIFLKMEGAFGKFVGGGTRMGMTFFGLIDRLRGAWRLLLADFAAPIIDSLKPLLTDAIGLVESFRATAVRAGQAVGNAFISAFALIKSGKTFELLSAGFKFAVTGAMDLLMRGLESAIAFLVNALPPVFDAATAKLRDPELWTGIQMQMNALGASLVAAFREAAGDKATADWMRTAAGTVARQGGEKIANAGGNSNAGEQIRRGLMAGIEAAADVLARPASEGLEQSRQEFRDLFQTVREEVAKMRRDTAVPEAAEGKTADATVEKTNTMAGAIKDAMVLTTSLARVGGGGFGMTFTPMLTEQRKGNSLLQKIEMNTRSGGMTLAIV